MPSLNQNIFQIFFTKDKIIRLDYTFFNHTYFIGKFINFIKP
jgi:hypothetical protein